MGLFQFGLTGFVTLLVVVDPLGLVPIFASLTAGVPRERRREILRRAVLIAFGVALFFLLAGRLALAYLGVSVHAFAISGGVLLFATALPMLFGQRAGLQAPEQTEQPSPDDPSIFPLAIPLLSGPGALTSILLLTTEARGDLTRLAALVLASATVFAITWLVLRLSQGVIARVGEGGIHVATRVLGIVLAALAVQYVLNGVTGYYQSLRIR